MNPATPGTRAVQRLRLLRQVKPSRSARFSGNTDSWRKISIALIDPIAGVNLRLARYPPIVHECVSIRADHFCYGNLLRQISCVVPQLLRSAAANEMRVPACPLSTGLIC